ncbi:uncharacterized protein [Battus philenor]|uniref:uncharacterized protein isoform X2 n=1 Tax=Battus philenor TaxID=42288 RepID=UPI0035CF37FD
MESQRSSNTISQNSDDFKSLELCTTRNQQRLGSVFGNFTRHHKKGHRRRTTTSTTSTQSTIIYSTTENIDDASNDFTTSTYLLSTQETVLKLPKPLRLSSLMLDKDYEDVHNFDQLIKNGVKDLINKERHHSKHYERIKKEILMELDDTSLSKSLNKIKKLYRDSSASAVNKLNTKTNKGGIFLTDNCTTVVAQIGTTAILHCEVSDITENTVTWIRRKDYSLLSVGLVTYSADSRFFSGHGRHVKDWALHIKFATSGDAGYYECQVPTHPPTSIFFKLILVAAYAEIVGESEKIIHEGSMLKLVCVVKRSTEPPSYVFWYFENRMINYDLSETPAAMQHGNSSVTKTHIHYVTRAMIILVISILIIKENYREFG